MLGICPALFRQICGRISLAISRRVRPGIDAGYTILHEILSKLFIGWYFQVTGERNEV